MPLPKQPNPPQRATISVKASAPSKAIERFFAPCPRGLEQALATELAALGGQHIEVTDGGVGCSGEFELGQRACLGSRVASRVLWRLGEAEYRVEDDIYRLARGVDWPHLFAAHHTIRVETNAIRSPLRSLDFVSLKVKDAIVDKFRAAMNSRPSVDTSMPDMRIFVFLTEYKATIYLDLAGEALFKRGYRREGLAAPLRENLAAGMLLLKAWNGDRPLLDAMCGSGTILTEAALIATNTPPGLQRPFAFEKLRFFNAAAFKDVRAQAASKIVPLADSLIFGNDNNPAAIETTSRHLQNVLGAQAMKAVRLTNQKTETLPRPAENGLLLSNPPYGERMDELASLREWYPLLGAWMKRELAGWTACFITADRDMPGGIGFKPSKKTPLFNGALDCRLFEFQMYSGSKREPKTTEKPQGGIPLEHMPGHRERG
ncbi:MAG: THUMP domain-containing class I SAM-dependent RNA methyltransferase [Casimicrobium sp.]